MPGNVLLDAKHCKSYLDGVLDILYAWKYWALLWDVVKLFRSSLVLSDIGFIHDLLGKTKAGSVWRWLSLVAEAPIYIALPSVLWIMRFSSLAPGNRHYSGSCVRSRHRHLLGFRLKMSFLIFTIWIAIFIPKYHLEFFIFTIWIIKSMF